jgi:acyl-CoA thioester hydrolase
MHSKIHTYPVLIKESYLDAFGHMNNAMYLTLLEEARWDLITKNGYGLNKILETGIGPTILDIKLRFLKELRLRDEVTIETQLVSYEKKIGIITHKILRGEDVCCTAEFTIGLWNLAERKLILPTPEWLKAIGAENI